MHAVPSITVEELKAKRDQNEPLTLLDVREPREWAISELPGSVRIPLGALPQRFSELSRDGELVVYCRSGGRSAQAVQFLRQVGYAGAKNLTGGINHWAEVIDRSMRKY